MPRKRAAVAVSAAAPSAPPALAPETKVEYRRVDVANLSPSPLNPRRHATPATDLRDLAASIAAHDVLEPIVVRQGANDCMTEFEMGIIYLTPLVENCR